MYICINYTHTIMFVCVFVYICIYANVYYCVCVWYIYIYICHQAYQVIIQCHTCMTTPRGRRFSSVNLCTGSLNLKLIYVFGGGACVRVSNQSAECWCWSGCRTWDADADAGRPAQWWSGDDAEKVTKRALTTHWLSFTTFRKGLY